MGLWVILSAAIAGPLQLGDDVRFAEDIELERGSSTWTVDDGFLFPVRRDDALVGWVGVGSGAQTFAFEAPWEAERFANLWVVAGGEDVASVASAVRSQQWIEPVDVVMALSADPAISAHVGASKRVVRDRKAVGYMGADGVFNVVVTALDIDAARRQAMRAIRDRVPELALSGVDIHDALDLDALDEGPDRVLVDARTERSWRMFVEPAVDNLQGRWLSTVFDPYGWVDDALEAQVFVIGRGEDEVARWATVAGTPSTRPAGARVVHADANVMVSLENTGTSLRADVEQILDIASDTPTGAIALRQAFTEEQEFYESAPMATRFDGLTVETLDGEPLSRVASVFGQRPVDGVDAAVFQLPATLSPGETLQLRVKHADRWRNSHMIEVFLWGSDLADDWTRCNPSGGCGDYGQEEFIELGRVSAVRPVVSGVVGALAHPVELRVGTSLPEGWNAAIGGGATEERQQGDGRWWIAQTDSRARVTFAKDRGVSTHPSMGLPGIEVLGHGPDQSGVPPYLRSVFNFYGSVLPDLELPQMDLIRDADRPVMTYQVEPEGGRPLPKVTAVPGQVVIAGLREFGTMGPESNERWMHNHAPKAVERAVAGAVGVQWVMSRDLAARDRWLLSALQGYLRQRFTQEAWEPETLSSWDRLETEHLASQLHSAPSAPIAADDAWTELGGARWFAAIQARVGERALMRGLEAFLTHEERTTDSLSEALTAGAGRDMSHWVDFWVRAGVRPTVQATWWTDPQGQLVIEVEADTPYGRFECPLAVEDRKGSRRLWVDVRGGRGTVTVPLQRPAERVTVDPEGLLMLQRGIATRRDAVSSDRRPPPSVPSELR